MGSGQSNVGPGGDASPSMDSSSLRERPDRASMTRKGKDPVPSGTAAPKAFAANAQNTGRVVLQSKEVTVGGERILSPETAALTPAGNTQDVPANARESAARGGTQADGTRKTNAMPIKTAAGHGGPPSVSSSSQPHRGSHPAATLSYQTNRAGEADGKRKPSDRLSPASRKAPIAVQLNANGEVQDVTRAAGNEVDKAAVLDALAQQTPTEHESLERMSVIIGSLKETLKMEREGELECIASGFVSYDDYLFIAETLKSLSERFLTMSDLRAQRPDTDGTANQLNAGSLKTCGEEESQRRSTLHQGPTPAATIATLSEHALASRHNGGSVVKRYSGLELVALEGNADHTTMRGRGTPGEDGFAQSVSSYASTTATTAIMDPREAREPNEEWLSLREKLMHYSILKHRATDATTTKTTARAVTGKGGDDNRGKQTAAETSSSEHRGDTTSVSSPNGGPAQDTHDHHAFVASVTSAVDSSSSTAARYVAQAALASQTDSYGANNSSGRHPWSLNSETSTEPHATLGTRTQRVPGALSPYDTFVQEQTPWESSLTVEELLAITQRDEVLDYFLEGASRSDHTLRSKLKVLPPAEVFSSFFVSRTRKTFTPRLSKSLLDTEAADPDVDALAVAAEHFFFYQEDEMVKKLMLKTIAFSSKYLEKFSASLPMGVQARLSKNNYLSPSQPIISKLVACAVDVDPRTGVPRRREFFVSMQERLELLARVSLRAAKVGPGARGVSLAEGLGPRTNPSSHTASPSGSLTGPPGFPSLQPRLPQRPGHTFTSAEELLLCIAQLSSFVSSMISSFTLCAMLALSSRIAEARTAQKRKQRLRRRERRQQRDRKATEEPNGPSQGCHSSDPAKPRSETLLEAESARTSFAGAAAPKGFNGGKRRNTFDRALQAEPTLDADEAPVTFKKLEKGDAFFCSAFDEDENENDGHTSGTARNTSDATAPATSTGPNRSATDDAAVSGTEALSHGGGEEDGEADPSQLPRFAEGYCRKYLELSHKVFSTIRRRYPNVYLSVVNEFAADSEDSSGQPTPTPPAGTPCSPSMPSGFGGTSAFANVSNHDKTQNPKKKSSVAKASTLSIAVSLLVKLIFLFTGGINNIAADDRRANLLKLLETIPGGPAEGLPGDSIGAKRPSQKDRTVPASSTASVSAEDALGTASATTEAGANESEEGKRVGKKSFGSQQLPHPPPLPSVKSRGTFAFPEDIALEAALRIPALSRLTLLSHAVQLRDDIALIEKLGNKADNIRALPDDARVRQEKNLSKIERVRKASVFRLVAKAESCAACWRIFFQFLGFLPAGDRCPRSMVEWIFMFPLYTLCDRAKQELLFVHGILVNYSPLLQQAAGIAGRGFSEHRDGLLIGKATTPDTIPDLNVLKLSPVMREGVLQSTADLLFRELHRRQGSMLSSFTAPGSTLDSPRSNVLLSPSAVEGKLGFVSPLASPRVSQQNRQTSLPSEAAPSRDDHSRHSDAHPLPGGMSGGLLPAVVSASLDPMGLAERRGPAAYFISPVMASRGGGVEESTSNTKDFYNLCTRECGAPFLPPVQLSDANAASATLAASDVSDLSASVLAAQDEGGVAIHGKTVEQWRTRIGQQHRNQAVVLVTWKGDRRTVPTRSSAPKEGAVADNVVYFGVYEAVRPGDEVSIEIQADEPSGLPTVLGTESSDTATAKDSTLFRSAGAAPTQSATRCTDDGDTASVFSGTNASTGTYHSVASTARMVGSVADAQEYFRTKNETSAQDLSGSRTAISLKRYRSRNNMTPSPSSGVTEGARTLGEPAPSLPSTTLVPPSTTTAMDVPMSHGVQPSLISPPTTPAMLDMLARSADAPPFPATRTTAQLLEKLTEAESRDTEKHAPVATQQQEAEERKMMVAAAVASEKQKLLGTAADKVLLDKCATNLDSVALVTKSPKRHVVVAVFDGVDPHQQILVLNTNRGSLLHTAHAHKASHAGQNPVESPSTKKAGSPQGNAPTQGADVNDVQTLPITRLIHHRRNNPPLLPTTHRNYTWTNPLFTPKATVSGLAGRGSSDFPTQEDGVTGSVPFTIGFLLGNAMSNENVFQMPLAPLAFRIISRVLRYEHVFGDTLFRPSPAPEAGDSVHVGSLVSGQPSSKGSAERAPSTAPLYRTFERIVKLFPADASLLHDIIDDTKLLALLKNPISFLQTFDEETLADEIFGKCRNLASVVPPGKHGRPVFTEDVIHQCLCAVTRRFVRDYTDEMMLNIHSQGGTRRQQEEPLSSRIERQQRHQQSIHFWLEVIRGLKQTSLVLTPIFLQSSARTLQHLLCGSATDDEDRRFSFLANFIFSITDSVKKRVFGDFLFKVVLLCLENDFTLAEKRAILTFITGKRLLSRPGAYDRNDFIFIEFQVALEDDKRDHSPGGQAREASSLAHQGGDDTQSLVTSSSKMPSARGVASAETTDKRQGPSAVTPARVVSRITPRACDTLLNRLPSAHDCTNTLEIPCYWDFLLVGSQSKYVEAKIAEAIAADPRRHLTPAEKDDIAETVRDTLLVSLSDVNVAWDMLTSEEQVEVGRTFRALLVSRLQAAVANSAPAETVSSQLRTYAEALDSRSAFPHRKDLPTRDGSQRAPSVTDRDGSGDGTAKRASVSTLATSDILSLHGRGLGSEDDDDSMNSVNDDDLWYASVHDDAVASSANSSPRKSRRASPRASLEDGSVPRKKTSKAPTDAGGSRRASRSLQSLSTAHIPSPLRAFQFLQEEDTKEGRSTGHGAPASVQNAHYAGPFYQYPPSAPHAQEPELPTEAMNGTPSPRTRRASSIEAELAKVAKRARMKDNMYLWNVDEAVRLSSTATGTTTNTNATAAGEDGERKGQVELFQHPGAVGPRALADPALPAGVVPNAPDAEEDGGYRLAVAFSFGDSEYGEREEQSVTQAGSAPHTSAMDMDHASKGNNGDSNTEDEEHPLTREILNAADNLIAQEAKRKSYDQGERERRSLSGALNAEPATASTAPANHPVPPQLKRSVKGTRGSLTPPPSMPAPLPWGSHPKTHPHATSAPATTDGSLNTFEHSPSAGGSSVRVTPAQNNYTATPGSGRTTHSPTQGSLSADSDGMVEMPRVAPRPAHHHRMPQPRVAGMQPTMAQQNAAPTTLPALPVWKPSQPSAREKDHGSLNGSYTPSPPSSPPQSLTRHLSRRGNGIAAELRNSRLLTPVHSPPPTSLRADLSPRTSHHGSSSEGALTAGEMKPRAHPQAARRSITAEAEAILARPAPCLPEGFVEAPRSGTTSGAQSKGEPSYERPPLGSPVVNLDQVIAELWPQAKK